MSEKELNDWFCSLTIKQKEHIAYRLCTINNTDKENIPYPNCVNVWLPLCVEQKQTIHDHCTDKHGMWIQEGGDATIFSY